MRIIEHCQHRTPLQRLVSALAQIQLNIGHLEECAPDHWELPRLRALRTEWQATIARLS